MRSPGFGGAPARLSADSANRLGLTTHVGEQARVRRTPQPFLDERSKDDL